MLKVGRLPPQPSARGVTSYLTHAFEQVAHVALVGFDGGWGASHISPSLTTIEQNVVAGGDLLVNAVMADLTPSATGRSSVGPTSRSRKQ